jgi:hypothetical protein
MGLDLIKTFADSDKVLGLGLSFGQVIILLVIAIIGTIAIRFTFSLDLNKVSENRAKSNLSKLRNACTHVELIPHEDDRIESKSLFISPPGKIQWQCQRCGIVRYVQDGELKAMQEYYVTHIDEYNKKMKLFQRLLKKGKHI